MSTIIIFAGGTKIPRAAVDDLPAPDLVIAADSGYQIALSLGYDVDTLIGDMDSVGPLDDIPATTSIVRFPADKDATDLELAFELAVREQPQRIVLVGAEGGRFDHELSAVAMVCSDQWRHVPDIDWVRSDSISHVIRDTRRIQGDPGDLFSLIPVGGDATGVTTTGLQWELKGDTLHAGSSRGVSNILLRTEILIQVADGVLLGVFPSTPGG
ncbi:MAG: thiamine diphosphokinase [Acidimicrobiia bacterium]